MQNVYIVDAKRTAVGSFLGSLSSFAAHDLGSIVIKNLIESHKLPLNSVDEVIVGQVLTAGQGQNPARIATVNSGLDFITPAYCVNKVCGSGLKAIALGFNSIAMGQADLIIAGGQESMSNSPHGAFIRKGAKMGEINLVDYMLKDGLIDAFNNYHMGITAENVAKKYEISRDQQDEFSLKSQKKASDAKNSGYFKSQIVPVKVIQKKETTIFDQDEFIRSDATIESLAKLKPAFDPNGTVTAGNASGINDGAAMILLASEVALKKYNLTPFARIVNHASNGVDPSIMGIGPSVAVASLLNKINITKNHIDFYELNEAFASQALAVNKILDIPEEKVNLCGGSIAIGHPIGASGARIATTLLHNMKRLHAKRAIASLCIGGGMGIAMCFESL
ncbi:MAG: acetyl-CoA C-acetyltransferase [Alphaproteobacteria bacterium]|nr:acetyl-CoA C-acetyltransferase [Alphaproteobacteria bacterium]